MYFIELLICLIGSWSYGYGIVPAMTLGLRQEYLNENSKK